MKKWIANKVFWIVLIILAFIGLNYFASKQADRKKVAIAPVLTETEKAKFIIDTRKRKITIVRRKGDKQVIETITGIRDASMTVTKDGEVKTYAPTKGFVFEPGLSIGMDNQDVLLGLDAQFFYWRRLGLIGGVSAPPHSGLRIKDLRAHIALGYDLISNTSVYIGYNIKGSIQAGCRLRF